MAGEIARDGISTWQWLCDAGGIEIWGRDADFAEALRVALRPSAPTLEDALRETSTDDFISAFFSVAEPFVTMFQAILQFFEAAGVREGRAQWRISIEEEQRHGIREAKKDMHTARAVELPIGLRQAKSCVTAATPVLAAPSLHYTGFRGRVRHPAGSPVARRASPPVGSHLRLRSDAPLGHSAPHVVHKDLRRARMLAADVVDHRVVGIAVEAGAGMLGQPFLESFSYYCRVFE